MSRLPLLLSVPHAGLAVPDEVAEFVCLTPAQIEKDGDEQAASIYDLRADVTRFVTTDVARAFVDLNRAPDDRRRDGVVKTHTCWDEPVYDPFPPEDVIESLLARHYAPYHARLREEAAVPDVLLSIDCHTMAAFGPPIGPDPGAERPAVCLGSGDGALPAEWLHAMRESFERSFEGFEVTVDKPFRGGYITREHARRSPWMQLELSRAPFTSVDDKRRRVLEALRGWCAWAARRGVR